MSDNGDAGLQHPAGASLHRYWISRDASKRLLVLVAYYLAVIAALAINHWLSFKVNTSSILVLVALVAPFLVDKLSRLKFGDLELEFREVKQALNDVKEMSNDINARLQELTERARDYLRPQPLSISDEKAEEMREAMRRGSVRLTPAEIEAALASLDSNQRVPAYIQLQVNCLAGREPEPNYIAQLSNCFWLESFVACTLHETRPLWQLIVALQVCYAVLLDDESLESRVRLNMKHCFEYLRSDRTVDPGGECKERLVELLALPTTAWPRAGAGLFESSE
jgi:hypothetical protein